MKTIPLWPWNKRKLPRNVYHTARFQN